MNIVAASCKRASRYPSWRFPYSANFRGASCHQVRFESSPPNINGWNVISLSDYRDQIKSSRGLVLFDANDPKQRKGRLVEAIRPTFAPYNNEIHASHIKLINEHGKLVDASALLRTALADLEAQNSTIINTANKLYLVQIEGDVYLPPKVKNDASNPTVKRIAPRPPWRDRPPVCKLFSQKDLRSLAMAETKNTKEVEKKTNRGKEIETTWTVSAQDLAHVCRRLEEFLASGRNVTILIRRKKKWKEPPAEDVERALSELRKVAGTIPGAKLDSEAGEPGNSMLFEFKSKATASRGQWPDLVPGKTLQIPWQTKQKYFEMQLKDMKQSLKKGRHVAVRLLSDINESGEEAQSHVPAKEIIARIRLEAGQVRDAVEILPNFKSADRGELEEEACAKFRDWELRFEADSRNKTATRNITIDEVDGAKTLKLKLDWAKLYLGKDYPTRLFVHSTQIPAVQKMFLEGRVQMKGTEKVNEYEVFEVESLPTPKPTPFRVEWEGLNSQDTRQKHSQKGSDAIQSLLNLLKDGKEKAQRSP